MAGDPECYTARTGSAPNHYIVRTLASAVKTLAGEFVKIFFKFPEAYCLHQSSLKWG